MTDAIALIKAPRHAHMPWMATENFLGLGEYGCKSKACVRCKAAFDSA
jgi:hypothetical protein